MPLKELTLDEVLSTYPRPAGVPSMSGQRTHPDLRDYSEAEQHRRFERMMDDAEALPDSRDPDDAVEHAERWDGM